MLEKAAVLNNSSCSACAIGAICFADGPVPDFELTSITGLMGLAN